MALQKEILFTNGVTIKYHMINDIQIDNKNKQVKIKVASYTDETFRQKELDNLSKQNTYENCISQIIEENNKIEEERNKELVIQLSEQANSLIDTFTENLDLKVVTFDYNFENIVDNSMSNLYELLKQEEMFKDSIDV